MDDEFLRVFKVAVCVNCKRGSPRNQLIAKGKAKDKYCVTDKDLSKLATIGRVRCRQLRPWRAPNLAGAGL